MVIEVRGLVCRRCGCFLVERSGCMEIQCRSCDFGQVNGPKLSQLRFNILNRRNMTSLSGGCNTIGISFWCLSDSSTRCLQPQVLQDSWVVTTLYLHWLARWPEVQVPWPVWSLSVGCISTGQLQNLLWHSRCIIHHMFFGVRFELIAMDPFVPGYVKWSALFLWKSVQH